MKTVFILILMNLVCLSLQAQTLDEKVKEYQESKREALSPFVCTWTPLAEPRTTKVPDAYVTWTGSEIRMDKESPDPLIIKFNKLEYLIYSKGMFVVKKAEDGGEKLIDLFFGIQQPPPPPSGDDDSWKPPDDDKPNRWEWTGD